MSVAPFEIAVVSHQTDAYLLRLLTSIRKRVDPSRLAAVHVLDNASTDRTGELLGCFAAQVSWLRVHRSSRNLHHGPGLDLLLREACTSDWVLLLDSDTEVLSSLEGVVPDPAGPPPAFVGQIHPEPDELYAYLCHLLVHRPTYLSLSPFRAHGAPGLDYFRAVAARGLPYRRFRWRDHVRHFGQGTLRAIHRRGDTGNPLFAFAAEEVTRQEAVNAAREAFDAALRGSLDAFLAGRPDPGPAPECPEEPPAPPARRRLARGPFALRTARRLGLTQDPAEMRELLRVGRRDRPRRVVEIGTLHGGSLFLLACAASDDATLVSVDLPPWELDDPGELARRERLMTLAREGQRLHLIRRDSHAPGTRLEVEAALPGGRAELLFLDGDPSYDGIAGDFRSYAPLVVPGGLVAIAGLDPESGGRLFGEVRSAGAIEIRRGGRGIGLVRV